MLQIWTGPPNAARDIRRSLALMGVDSASTDDALGRTTVYVAAANIETARVLLDALEQVEVALAHQRALDVITRHVAEVPSWN